MFKGSRGESYGNIDHNDRIWSCWFCLVQFVSLCFVYFEHELLLVTGITDQ